MSEHRNRVVAPQPARDRSERDPGRVRKRQGLCCPQPRRGFVQTLSETIEWRCRPGVLQCCRESLPKGGEFGSAFLPHNRSDQPARTRSLRRFGGWLRSHRSQKAPQDARTRMQLELPQAPRCGGGLQLYSMQSEPAAERPRSITKSVAFCNCA